MLRRSLALTLALAGLLVSETALAQGSREDYQRSAELQSWVQDKVIGLRVRFNWVGEGRAAWAKVPGGGGTHRYVFVDTADGIRRDAFNHDRLAAALGEVTGQRFEPNSLPLEGLSFEEEGNLRFRCVGKSWLLDTRDYSVGPTPGADASNGATVEVLGRIRPSRATGNDSSILFINHTKGPIKLYWIDSNNDRQPYETIQSGAQHDQHTYAGHIWLAADESGKPLGVYRAADAAGVAVVDGHWRPSPQRPDRGRPRGASPDGKWAAQIVDHNVVVVRTEREEGEERLLRLTQDGTEQDRYLPRFHWSPDSTKLVVLREEAGESRTVHMVESSPKDQLQPKLKSITYAKPGDRLPKQRPALFHVEDEKQVEVDNTLFNNPWSIRDLAWSDDSESFSFLYNQRGHQLLRVICVDGESGAARVAIDESTETFVCYSSKSYFYRLPGTSRAIWMSERDGWNHLYLYDLATGKLLNPITSGEWVVRGVEQVDEEKGQILFTAGGIHPGQDPYHVHYARVKFDGTGLTVLTDGDGTHDIDLAPDGEHFIDRYSRVDLPPVTELRRMSDGGLVATLHNADWSPLLAAGWQPPERFVAKGRDGSTDIHGVLYRPRDFDAEKKYSVIEYIYAGPHSAHVPKRFSPFLRGQETAELGFVVVRIDGMGTSHRSKAFHDVCWQNLADAGFPDRKLWIQAAAADRPWMDLSRVGIYGGSAGGQNAMRALIDHGDFYHAAAADCGCHDNRMDKVWWNEQWMGWPIGPHYAASSNVDHAHRLQGKLLLTVGELDTNVDPASTMQVANALIKADKDFDLIVLPGANHGAGSGHYGKRRMFDFFVEHLLRKQPRWERR